MIRAADNWKDYVLLDASQKQRLERWGEYTLARPDPQVLWNTPKNSSAWDQAHAVYHRSDKGGGHWEYKKQLPAEWTVNYGELCFKVSPTGFKHTGLFPEQAANWDQYTRLIRAAGRPVNVLNLFAYTGGATLACLAAGAGVCHVDSSKGMVEWAKRNAQLSGLRDAHARYIVDDCLKFVAREQRRGVRYDALILDPPSYGRGPSGEIWKLEDNIFELMSACVSVLAQQPLFVAVNSYTTGISPSVMAYILGSLLGDRQGSVSCGEIGLRVKSSGLVLPCGNTAWFLGGKAVLE